MLEVVGMLDGRIQKWSSWSKGYIFSAVLVSYTQMPSFITFKNTFFQVTLKILFSF